MESNKSAESQGETPNHKDDPQVKDQAKESLKSAPVKNKLSKSCLFTLVIYAQEERRVNYLQELVDTILDKFPCRIIFIKASQTADRPFFNVTTSTVTSGQTTSPVSCDQVIIETSLDQIHKVPFVIVPHIASDLPLYLLWGQNPFEDKEIFPHLKAYASRVIFDSQCADSILHFCKEMQYSLNTLPMDIMDISWALISNWRDLLIHLFDSPHNVKDLDAIKSVIINYNSHTSDSAQHLEIRALYLQAWLASCLKWEYKEMEYFDNCPVITYVGPVHPSIVALSPQDVPLLPPGSITGIEIQTVYGTSYYLSRRENLSQVLVHISTKDTCELPFTIPLPNVHRGLTFMRELFFSHLGERYKEMLKILSKTYRKTNNNSYEL